MMSKSVWGDIEIMYNEVLDLVAECRGRAVAYRGLKFWY